jgi:hypothetical protein
VRTIDDGAVVQRMAGCVNELKLAPCKLTAKAIRYTDNPLGCHRQNVAIEAAKLFLAIDGL